MSAKGDFLKRIINAATSTKPLAVAPTKRAKVAGEEAASLAVKRPGLTRETQMPLFKGDLVAHTNKLRERNLNRFLGDSELREASTSSRDTSTKPPIRVYHGTASTPFDRFQVNPQGVRPGKTVNRNAIFAAEDPEFANQFISQYLSRGGTGSPHVLPLWLRAERPLDITDTGLNDLIGTAEEAKLAKLPGLWRDSLVDDLHDTDEGDRWRILDDKIQSGFFGELGGIGDDVVPALKQMGYDSVRMRETHPTLGEEGGIYDTWAAFSPSQFKSAIGNRGTFDPTDERLIRARGGRVSSLAVKRKRKR